VLKQSLTACCITGNFYNKHDMIKLVISADGLLCFDLKHNLVGKSFFFKNSRLVIAEFLQKTISGEDFSDINSKSGSKWSILDNANLVDYIAQVYLTQMLSFISLAKKSGNLILGKEKISHSLQKAGIIVQASDASFREKFSQNGVVSICEVFDIAQLSRACGKENTRYLLITNRIAESFKTFYDKYNCYLIG
jgi:ribosomal protein L7Ae-like RNA K-turn-binding protein